MTDHDIASAVSPEAVSVTFAALLVWLSALVQHFSNVHQRGPQYVMSDRSVSPSLEGFHGRATRTLANNIESALMWALPVAVIIVTHRTTLVSQYCAMTYMSARAVFALSYWLKIPVVRSLAWFVGMVCCATVIVSAVV